MKFFNKLFSVRTLVILILLIEITLFVLAAIYFNEFFAEIKSAFTFLSLFVALFIFSSKCNSSYKIAWLLFIIVFPAFGTVCYILFANKKFTYREKKKIKPTREALKIANASKESNNIVEKIDKVKDPDAYFIGRYLNDCADTGIFKNTKVTYFPWGQDGWKVILEKLESAKHYIFMEYFIIEPGVMWDPMLEILSRKAKEGVDVRLLYDDFGCLSTLPSRYFLKMRELGIKCYAVNKLRPFVDIRMNNRDHRKIMVIDGHTGFTGGINLADEYINEKERFGKWKDNAIMLEGDGVFGLTSIFLSTWVLLSREHIVDFSPYLPSLYAKEVAKPRACSGYVAPYGSFPFANETIAKNIYVDLIMKAKDYIYITTPYLILDDEMNNALIKAAKGGVKIKLITPHIPDKETVFELTRSFYKDLVMAGVEIYEFTPGFIHAKTFVIDGEMAIVGTINLDYRSLFLHMENGCFMYKCDCIKDIQKDLNETIDDSRLITKEMVKSSPFSKRVLRFFLRMFASAL